MKPSQSSSEQHKHSAAERRSARNPFRGKRAIPVVKLEEQYKELCRLREQVQIAESRQRVLLRSSDDDVGPWTLKIDKSAPTALAAGNARVMNDDYRRTQMAALQFALKIAIQALDELEARLSMWTMRENNGRLLDFVGRWWSTPKAHFRHRSC
jgi:hypothetical protein